MLPAGVVPPTVTQNPSGARVSVCSAAPVTLTATASGSPTPTVQWQVTTDDGLTWSNDTTDTGATTTTLSVTPTFSTETLYRAVFTNPGGTATSGDAAVTSFGPPPQVTSPTSVTVTAGQSATFTASISCTGASVQWLSESPGASAYVPVPGATSTTLTIPSTTLAQSGTQYKAVFSGSLEFGSPITFGTSPATLTVNPPPNSPTVTRLLPSSGGPFSVVLIAGTNFTHVRSVSFGGQRAFFLTISRGLIIALAPVHASGVVDVTVTTPNGTSPTSSGDQFTYQ